MDYNSRMTEHDVAVVGAGPIGIELAVALKRAGVDYVHFDAKQIGYTISWFAPQTKFFSSNERIAIAGVPLNTADQSKATREEYLAYLRGVVQQFDLKINTYEPLVGIERQGDGAFVLRTTPGECMGPQPVAPTFLSVSAGRTRPADGWTAAAGDTGRNACATEDTPDTDRNVRATARQWRVRKLVLVTGGTDHPRRLNIPGEDLPHVSHYFRDPHVYFGKKLLIVGGKNSAVEAALRCHAAGAHVSMSYRRDRLPEKSIKYWLLPEINYLIEQGRINGYYHTQPVEIRPDRVTLERDSERFDVAADFVLLLIGYRQDNTLFKLAGVELQGDCGAPVFDERTMETNVPGVYVAGTAVGGTQDKYRVFIENCHVHVDRIVASLTGNRVDADSSRPQEYAQPES
jgi:thioredoxin reductase (NADPH)